MVPLPLPELLVEIHETPLTADQAHPLPAVMFAVPPPPVAATEAVPGEIE